MTTRRPLGASSTDNVQRGPTEVNGDSHKGVDQGTFGKHTLRTKTSIAELRQDLDRAKARRQKHELVPTPPTEGNDKALEKRLHSLVEAHNSSKAKYKGEMEALRTINSQLQNSQEQTRSELRSAQSETLRLKLEMSKSKSDTASTSSSAQRHFEEKAEWHKERREMNCQINELQTENTKLRGDAAELGNVVAERNQLQDTLDITVQQYSQRYMSTVSRKEHDRLKWENERMRAAASRQREVELGLMLRLKASVDEVQILKTRLSDSETERRDAEAMVDDLLEQRKLDREMKIPSPPIEEVIMPLSTGDVPSTRLMGLCLSHSDMLSVQHQIEERNILMAHRDLMESSEKAATAHISTRATLTSLQRSHAQLEHSYKEVQAAHAPCTGLIAGLNDEVLRWQQSEAALAEQLSEVQVELKRLEDKSRGDRESLRRANDSAMRRKAAEDALEEEISALRSAVDEANEFRDMYENLLEEYRVMSERETLAHEEVERLGLQNANLIGHNNGDQKINYVESVRREMALTKHELATTRHLLNNAQDRIDSLTQEVESYKAVDNAMNLGGSTRTRIVRRLPEGTWLGKSVRGRSVSGPTGR